MEWVFIGFQVGFGFVGALIAIVILFVLAVVVKGIVTDEDLGPVVLWIIGLALMLTWIFVAKL